MDNMEWTEEWQNHTYLVHKASGRINDKIVQNIGSYDAYAWDYDNNKFKHLGEYVSFAKAKQMIMDYEEIRED